MNCKQCNTELPMDAKFCDKCGCEVKNKENKLRFVAGILYALAALLFIFLPTVGAALTSAAAQIYAMEGVFSVTAFSIVVNAVGRLDIAVYSTAGLMLAVAALSLLLKRKGAYKGAMISGIAGLAAVGYGFFMVVAVPAFPHLLASVYTTEAEVIARVVQIAREPVFITRCVIAAVITAGIMIPSFIIMLKAKQKEENEVLLSKKMERSAASLMTFLPLFCAALRIKSTVATLYIGRIGGTAALAANSTADGIVAGLIGISALMLIIITVYCVLMKKFRYPLFIFPGLGAILLYGIIALCRMQTAMQSVYVPQEIYDMTSQAVLFKVLGTAFMLVAVYFWIAATARGNMRAWGQIIFAVMFILIAVMIESLSVFALKLTIAVPLTEIILGNAMLAAAIPLSIRNREK